MKKKKIECIPRVNSSESSLNLKLFVVPEVVEVILVKQEEVTDCEVRPRANLFFKFQ
jgi:hypothetical protein